MTARGPAALARPSMARGIVRMLRPPNLFTAIAEPVAGLAIVRAGALSADDTGLFLVPASAALYLAGLALNDFFDRNVDAAERPDRPIPSGAVPPAVAVALGCALLAAGVLCAYAAGPRCLPFAIALAACIATYDAIPRGSAVAFLLMGLCRALNFAMPFALVHDAAGAWLFAPALLGAYITALTYLARDEVGGNARARAQRGVLAFACVFAGVAAVVATSGASLLAWIWLAALGARMGQVFLPLWRGADARTTGRAIGRGVLTVPLFDSVFVALAGHPGWALAVVGLVVPGMLLKRFYYVT